MKSQRILIALIVALTCINAWAGLVINGQQVPYDSANNLWLCVVSANDFSGNLQATINYDESWSGFSIDGTQVDNGNTFTFASIAAGKTYAVSYNAGGNTITGNITFTYLPVVEVTGQVGETAQMGTVLVTLPSNGQTGTLQAQIAEYNIAKETLNKQNIHLHFVDSNGEDETHTFFGLRNSCNWLLEGGAMDAMRVRNKVGEELWLDMASDPCYITEAPTAINGSRGQMVEVILNGEYYGIYNMCEPIDRQQLQLKEYDSQEGIFHGQEWYTSTWTRTASMSSPATYDNNRNTWDGIVSIYPTYSEVHPTDWSTLSEGISFVKQCDATDDLDALWNNTSTYFDVPVVVDYYIFITSLLALDNETRNIFYACYDKQGDKRITLVPWDLDVTLGQFLTAANASQYSPERPNNWISNLLLLYMKLDSRFSDLVSKRYYELRENVLDTDRLIDRYRTAVDELEGCGAAQREENRWSGNSDILGKQLDLSAAMDQVEQWITTRMAYIDQNIIIKSEGGDDDTIKGDVNNDGAVTLADINSIINILVGAQVDEATEKRADVNNDSVVTLADINEVINILLQ